MPVSVFVNVEDAIRPIVITEEEFNLILAKRKEDEIREKRDKYIAELNDLFKRMREDDFAVYFDGAGDGIPGAHVLKSDDFDSGEVIDAINIY